MQLRGLAPTRAMCRSNRSSWLNWIESGFAALRYFALNGTDHHNHGEQDDTIDTYIRWRNQRAHPKRDFARRLPDPAAGLPRCLTRHWRTLPDLHENRWRGMQFD
ncbi:hypothetical protein [Nocardia sp. NPDC049707]|uniref:hypothetical protein n=1 Tax=Nocardia sp. NPDC049707 TaxID=3154735 RepID=UPI003445BCB5